MKCSTYEQHLAHLVMMAKRDKAYAWHRAQQMDKCLSGLWAGIAAALTAEMRRANEHPIQTPTLPALQAKDGRRPAHTPRLY